MKIDDRTIYQIAHHLTHQNTEHCSDEVKALLAAIPERLRVGFRDYRDDLPAEAGEPGKGVEG